MEYFHNIPWLQFTSLAKAIMLLVKNGASRTTLILAIHFLYNKYQGLNYIGAMMQHLSMDAPHPSPSANGQSPDGTQPLRFPFHNLKTPPNLKLFSCIASVKYYLKQL